MHTYTIKKGTIPLMQMKRRPLWRIVSAWGLAGLIALTLLGYGFQHIS